MDKDVEQMWDKRKIISRKTAKTKATAKDIMGIIVKDMIKITKLETTDSIEVAYKKIRNCIANIINGNNLYILYKEQPIMKKDISNPTTAEQMRIISISMAWLNLLEKITAQLYRNEYESLYEDIQYAFRRDGGIEIAKVKLVQDLINVNTITHEVVLDIRSYYPSLEFEWMEEMIKDIPKNLRFVGVLEIIVYIYQILPIELFGRILAPIKFGIRQCTTWSTILALLALRKICKKWKRILKNFVDDNSVIIIDNDFSDLQEMILDFEKIGLYFTEKKISIIGLKEEYIGDVIKLRLRQQETKIKLMSSGKYRTRLHNKRTHKL